MNEQQINSGATAPTSSAEQPAMQTAATPVQVVVKEANWTQPAYLLSGVLAVLLAANWWSSQNQISTLREEVARRLLSADTTSSETKILAKNVQETTKEIQTKVILLEGKQSEAQSQQLALEQLYQDLSKNRDEWALAEIEQVLSTASQQLQLAGNVPGALIALQNADSRLAKSDKPQFITIRRAIAKDIEKLKALPSLDLPGIALRLDSVIAQVDRMPLWVDEKSVVTATPPKAPLRVLSKSQNAHGSDKTDKSGKLVKSVTNSDEDVGDVTWSMRMQDAWQSFSSEMWGEVKQLVRIRNVETPDALLLTPTQSYFARENLKLRLLNARLALLSRNETVFRSDINAAQDAVAKYFDTRAKQTQTVQALLVQVQGSNLSIEMPSLSESLNAVRNYKVKP
ncbi:uroporphyrinogen-III C-methyltransferase [Undibacterium jejuense]|uniref:Uroporphyrinogen-III C-methyltransferase n=1 Tax=Undibacterium jejuense TaxID=1344949 RepID=A0A923HSY2_9BURK|nr:uroporphyrinogen-III C-methyltransferase [Undibacterium jejuense]MBC3864143.1 uroporphyrinogen-III C-methyltransferase [Undibacterium jejuense]